LTTKKKSRNNTKTKFFMGQGTVYSQSKTAGVHTRELRAVRSLGELAKPSNVEKRNSTNAPGG